MRVSAKYLLLDFAIRVEYERQRVNLLFFYGFQFIWIDAQSLDHGRGHLLIECGSPDSLLRCARVRNQESGVNIILVQPAVLRDFRTAGENHAGVNLQDDIRRARIAARIIPLVLQRLPGEDFLDAEGLFALWRADLRDDTGKKFLIGEPDQGTVVGNIKCIRGSQERGGLAIAYGMQFVEVDRRLAVLGANDEERRIVDVFFFQLRDDASQGLIDKVQFKRETFVGVPSTSE